MPTGAFNRYEDYLSRRKSAADESKAFVTEQKFLSEQVMNAPLESHEYLGLTQQDEYCITV